MRGYGREMRVISRRDTLLALGGAAVYLPNRSVSHTNSPPIVGGIPIDLILSALTNTILRLSLVPARSERAAVEELNDDPVLALSFQGRLVMKDQSVGSSRVLAWGNRRLRVAGSPITFEIENDNGQLIQSLRVDDQGAVTFKSSRGPVF